MTIRGLEFARGPSVRVLVVGDVGGGFCACECQPLLEL